MIIFSAILLFIIGGLAGRIRGSALPLNDTEKRYGVWGIPIGALVFAASHNPVFGLLAAVFAGLGASLGYWGQFDFSVPGNWNTKNYSLLTLSGVFRFIPLFIAAATVGYEWRVLPAVLAGATFVPIYMFCYKYLSAFTFGTLFNSWTCWGEFIFWGTIFSAFAAGLFL